MCEGQRCRRAAWAAACGLAVLASSAVGEPYFSITTPMEWRDALYVVPPRVMPLPEPEGWDYLNQWGQFLVEGEPYPPTEFMESELYVWEGDPSAPGLEDSGLVMVWGPGPVPGDYASAWMYDYQVDPDLSNAVVSMSVFAPQWGPNGQITQISFGIRDVAGRVRSWYWNVPSTIPYDTLTNVTIDVSQTGLGAANPPADGYMNAPGFDPTQAQFFIADENAKWIGPALPVPPPGAPHDGLWNLWHDIIVIEKPELKWSQPPEPTQPDNLYYGWNEYSEWWHGPTVADDWVCTTNTPVTDVHWWGSFVDWRYADPPPMMPSHFHIQFWTDLPVGHPQNPDPFSHPGQLLHEVLCYDYNMEFVGWDFDPIKRTYEACFRYDQLLRPDEYFYQEPDIGIYWISISACYDGDPPAEFPWGWKTRPRDPNSPAPDDAVVMLLPVQPPIGARYEEGYPLWWPTPDDSWDMAFELTTQGPGDWKWEQKPELEPTGLDVMDLVWAGDPTIAVWLADDWKCTASGPITEIEVWGSWLRDGHPQNPGPTHGSFTLAIYSDIPAAQSPTGYSMPGDLLWRKTFGPWSSPPADYGTEHFASGPEFYFDPVNNKIVGPDTQVWLYTFPVDSAEAFVQEEGVVYWLGVVNFDPNEDGVFDMRDLAFQYGWKTSPEHWNDDGVFSQGGDHLNPSVGPWNELRYPPGHPLGGESIDLSFRLRGTTSDIKWAQPPQDYHPDDAFHGWDEPSVYGERVAADDWLCRTDQPVTDVHWWGSFIDWYEPYPPYLPGFHLGIWTDVPNAGGPSDFSHPGKLLWVNECHEYTWEFVGWDFDPRDPMAAPEATFKFTQYLEEPEWFWQDPGQNVYWLSIASVPCPCNGDINGDGRIDNFDVGPFNDCMGQPPVGPCERADLNCDGVIDAADRVIFTCLLTSGGNQSLCCPMWDFVHEHPFGCKTRPRDAASPAPDAAVVITDPTELPIGAVFREGFKLYWPNWEDEWDLAFELTTKEVGPRPEACCFRDGSCLDLPATECIMQGGLPMGPGTDCANTDCMFQKWNQTPTRHPNEPGFFQGWNELSLYHDAQFVADDFRCYDERPITDIHWWGSYIDWREDVPPQMAPTAFHIGLWTDVPAGPGNDWSHPGEMIRQWYVVRSDLSERKVGMDLAPTGLVETCFQYDYYLPQEHWFWQPGDQNVYWFSISAIYATACDADFDWDGDVDAGDAATFAQCVNLPPPLPPQCWQADLNGDGLVNVLDTAIFACQFQAGWPDPACCNFPPVNVPFPWGWKTRLPSWNDDAVRVFDPLPPRLFRLPFMRGEPIWWPTPEDSWDMAFVLTTPEPPRPLCPGDLNCDGWIDFGDINPFVLALSNWEAWKAEYPYCPPKNADINGDGQYGGPQGFGDINPFVALLASGGGQPIPCP